MKLYKISQNKNNGYDTYDSAVVCAKDEFDAKKIHPGGGGKVTQVELDDHEKSFGLWVALEDVDVEYIGEADSNLKEGVIVASFNAG